MVEVMERILPVEDAEISAFAKKSFEKQGMKIMQKAVVKQLRRLGIGFALEHIRGRRIRSVAQLLEDRIEIVEGPSLGLFPPGLLSPRLVRARIATLWGDDLPVEEVAPWADAIPYELVCGVMNREDSEIVP